MGGDCSRVQHELSDVLAIQRTSQDASVLEHLGNVRERMLDRRYRGN
jgi:hypothetical protein